MNESSQGHKGYHSFRALAGGVMKKVSPEGFLQQNTPPHEHRVILATGKYPGEGFDLPSLDTLFLVFPFS